MALGDRLTTDAVDCLPVTCYLENTQSSKIEEISSFVCSTTQQQSKIHNSRCYTVTVWAWMIECRPYGVLDHPYSSLKRFALADDVNVVEA